MGISLKIRNVVFRLVPSRKSASILDLTFINFLAPVRLGNTDRTIEKYLSQVSGQKKVRKPSSKDFHLKFPLNLRNNLIG